MFVYSYGRARISLVFRSVRLSLPSNSLGWDYGTIEVTACTSSVNDLPSSLHNLRLKVRTSISHGKLYSLGAAEGKLRWHGKKNQVVHLAVQQRYRSCLVIEFRKNRLGLDKTPAFAILWLPDIPDEEEHTSSLSVYGGDKANLKRAASNSECDLGEQIGSITITAKFRRGLSRYHKHLASGNSGVQDVLEVLDTAADSKEVAASLANNDEWDDGDDSSTSSESEDSSDERHAFGESIKNKLRGESTMGGDDGEDNGKSPLRQLKDYSDHSGQLHQHHRGLMQWKVRTDILVDLLVHHRPVCSPQSQGARTAKWMKTKMTDGKDKIADSLKHHDRNPGIETEV